jgi:hypothetical protein
MEILTFIANCADSEIRSRLQFTLCSKKFHELALSLTGRTTNALALKGLNFIVQFQPEKAGGFVTDSRFKRIIADAKAVL